MHPRRPRRRRRRGNGQQKRRHSANSADSQKRRHTSDTQPIWHTANTHSAQRQSRRRHNTAPQQLEYDDQPQQRRVVIRKRNSSPLHTQHQNKPSKVLKSDIQIPSANNGKNDLTESRNVSNKVNHHIQLPPTLGIRRPPSDPANRKATIITDQTGSLFSHNDKYLHLQRWRNHTFHQLANLVHTKRIYFELTTADKITVSLDHAFVWAGRSETYADPITFRHGINNFVMAVGGVNPHVKIHILGVPPIPDADQYTTTATTRQNQTIRQACKQNHCQI